MTYGRRNTSCRSKGFDGCEASRWYTEHRSARFGNHVEEDARLKPPSSFPKLSLVSAPLAIVLLLAAASVSVAATRYDASLAVYASPTGTDSNPGTYQQPLSLSGAQAWVRANDQNMTEDLTVYLEGGLYRLSAPLELGPLDSGTNGFNVVWTAAPGETPIIGGSEQVTGWVESDPTRDLWSAPLPPGLQTAQLYVNGVRAWETSGSLPVALTRTSRGYRASSPLLSTWRNPSELE